jgi:uncharacterized protein with PQ loop repeat
MEDYFKELGMGIFAYTYLVFPIMSFLVGIITYNFKKNIWLGPLFTGILSLFFYLWYSIDVNEDYNTIYSMLHLVGINIIVSIFGSILSLIFKKNKAQSLKR